MQTKLNEWFRKKEWILNYIYLSLAHTRLSIRRCVSILNTLSMVHICEPNSLQTIHKRFANQMGVCVDGPTNMCCTICEWFAYHSPQTEICQFFAQTQREFGALGILCSPQVCGKLIYHVPSANCSCGTDFFFTLALCSVCIPTLHWLHCPEWQSGLLNTESVPPDRPER